MDAVFTSKINELIDSHRIDLRKHLHIILYVEIHFKNFIQYYFDFQIVNMANPYFRDIITGNMVRFLDDFEREIPIFPILTERTVIKSEYEIKSG